MNQTLNTNINNNNNNHNKAHLSELYDLVKAAGGFPPEALGTIETLFSKGRGMRRCLSATSACCRGITVRGRQQGRVQSKIGRRARPRGRRRSAVGGDAR